MEAVKLLGFKDRSTVVRMVLEHRLVPSRKLPGATGAYLFWRADVQRIADLADAKGGDAA
jgi:hypothetical protein